MAITLPRRKTIRLHIGSVPVGDGAPITVQTMTKTDTRDVEATVRQIEEAARAGCHIVRVGVPDQDAAAALRTIVSRSPLPVVADIHFDHRLALAALDAGVHGLRLNPGNIRQREKVRDIARAARERGVPIRVGVNSGSLAPRFRNQIEAGAMTTPEAMVQSAREHIALLEEHDVRQIKVSLKSSSVLTTLEAYRLLATDCPYPFHAGITEAGTQRRGIAKSALGIGLLVMEGLGDTIRVSLTAPPVEEVLVGRMILQDFALLEGEPEVVSCPTCARTEIDVAGIAQEVERLLYEERVPIRVAVMGCVVNGPGEAREADLGITGGKGVGVLFRKGEIVRQVAEEDLLKALRDEILKYKHDAPKGT